MARRRRLTRLGALAAVPVVAAAVIVAVLVPGRGNAPQRLSTTPPPAPTTSAPASSAGSGGGPVTAARLVSADFGIAATAPPARVWTTSGSRRWTNVTPAGMTGAVDDVYATDARHLWALASACSLGGGNDTLWRSSDGGSSWASATVPGEVCAAGSTALVRFADRLHGWIVVLDPTGPVAHLYSSSDGGRTWTAPIGRLPELGDAGLSTASDGYLGAAHLPGIYSPGLYATGDGGRTWSPVHVALPPPSVSWQPVYGVPTFTGASAGILPVTFVKANTEQVAWYTTTSGGRTWTLRSGPRPVGLARLSVPAPEAALTSVAGPRTWWVVARALGATATQVSDNGGATWKTATAKATWAAARQLTAADARSAWLLTTDGELFATSDAGSSWTLASPPATRSVIVPDVVGFDRSLAVRTLSALGLDHLVRDVPRASVAAGQVVTQSPPAGAVLPRGGAVTIGIAQGPPPTAGPVSS